MTAATLREVLDTWEAQRQTRAVLAPDARLALARAALDFGHPTLTCEILRDATGQAGASDELRHLAALAHARIGDYRQAAALIAPLLAMPNAVPVRVLPAPQGGLDSGWAPPPTRARRRWCTKPHRP